MLAISFVAAARTSAQYDLPPGSGPEMAFWFQETLPKLLIKWDGRTHFRGRFGVIVIPNLVCRDKILIAHDGFLWQPASQVQLLHHRVDIMLQWVSWRCLSAVQSDHFRGQSSWPTHIASPYSMYSTGSNLGSLPFNWTILPRQVKSGMHSDWTSIVRA